VLFESRPHPCSYLPGRTAVDEFGTTRRLDPALYERMMNLGFRRSGRIVYRPMCDGCRECVPLRVKVADFRLSRSQGRVLRRNADVSVRVDAPQASDEKYRIFREYLQYQHNGAMGDGREDFELFLYDSPTDTREMVLSVAGRVVGAGIIDVCPACVSSVYFYFDPAHARRSLGVFSTLMEIDWCRRIGVPCWYAGFYVRDCERMNYKAGFRPYELLGADGQWRRPVPEEGRTQ
jgi:arginine-tRNA-protein transferase